MSTVTWRAMKWPYREAATAFYVSGWTYLYLLWTNFSVPCTKYGVTTKTKYVVVDKNWMDCTAGESDGMKN